MNLGMMAGTSPSICALAGGVGWAVAFQANTGDLWVVGESSQGSFPGNMNLTMMPGTKPSIRGLNPVSWEVAFQFDNGQLWVVGSDAPASSTGWEAPPVPAEPGLYRLRCRGEPGLIYIGISDGSVRGWEDLNAPVAVRISTGTTRRHAWRRTKISGRLSRFPGP
jgi:hypothetical protein